MSRAYLTVVLRGLICFLSSVIAIWPAPTTIQQGSQYLTLSSNFTFLYVKDTPSGFWAPPPDLKQAVKETQKFILTDAHQVLVPDRGESLRSVVTSSRSLSKLELKLSANGHIRSITNETRQAPSLRVEAYTLEIKLEPVPEATLTANSSLGFLRGLQSFSQLVYTLPPVLRNDPLVSNRQQLYAIPDGSQRVRYLRAPVSVQDAPSFKWRGLLLDTSRNFFPIPDLKRTIDAMSWAKLNIFHWHIVDAQSWPLQVPNLPLLDQKGAYSPSERYLTHEIQDFIAHANSKGVDVMVEFDTPGHTSVVGDAYPELVACKNFKPWWDYAAEPPSGQLRIMDDRAVELAKQIYTTIAQEVPGTLFSTGGDEVNQKCYATDKPTQDALTSKNMTLTEALFRFVNQTQQALRAEGKTPVIWEELVLDDNLTLGSDTIVAVWRSSINARSVLNKGYRIVHAASDFTYLDCGIGEWLGNETDGKSWCDPFKTWQKIYSFNPYTNVSHSQYNQILGGQALLWSEQADPQNLDTLLWPRALAAAEVYWTGAEHSIDGQAPAARNSSEALPRIHDMRYRMVQRKIRATPLQPQYCALRIGECDGPPA